MNFGVVLIHGQYPQHRGDKPGRERCKTVDVAKQRVREIYRGKIGWWYLVPHNGREVWSSDADIAALHDSREGLQ